MSKTFSIFLDEQEREMVSMTEVTGESITTYVVDKSSASDLPQFIIDGELGATYDENGTLLDDVEDGADETLSDEE